MYVYTYMVHPAQRVDQYLQITLLLCCSSYHHTAGMPYNIWPVADDGHVTRAHHHTHTKHIGKTKSHAQILMSSRCVHGNKCLDHHQAQQEAPVTYSSITRMFIINYELLYYIYAHEYLTHFNYAIRLHLCIQTMMIAFFSFQHFVP